MQFDEKIRLVKKQLFFLISVVWTSYFEVIPLISHLHEDDEEHKKTHHTQCIRRIEDLDQTDDSKDEKQSRWRLEEIPSFINHKSHQHLDEAGPAMHKCYLFMFCIQLKDEAT